MLLQTWPLGTVRPLGIVCVLGKLLSICLVQHVAVSRAGLNLLGAAPLPSQETPWPRATCRQTGTPQQRLGGL
eukprot:3072745-Pyramimonas_sp.AAC.1